MYWLQFYHLKGMNKGNRSHREYFDKPSELIKRYKEVFRRDLYTLNPTLWKDDERIRYANGKLEKV